MKFQDLSTLFYFLILCVWVVGRFYKGIPKPLPSPSPSPSQPRAATKGRGPVKGLSDDVGGAALDGVPVVASWA